ncbi:NF-kappa-B-repressing factor-like [Topomyia yanbarensis]|uniref:NF-kappa-B-repressing factor-like n=1 Tax=Topomyia yanbarensis TaxID=2498891 RepID=UPI00273C2CC9|nr:NF-kappa-B-repressing factor-like [Topomyia yanbarensis]
MTTGCALKRKPPIDVSWRRKIVRTFYNGWIESDKLCNNVSKPPAQITGSSYINFVTVNEHKLTKENVTDPGLSKRVVQRLNNVIAYMYNDNMISLKLTFEQAGLLLESNYDEKQRKFSFLINDQEICQAEGEKQTAHTEAREKLIEILQYYCWTVKRLKEYHTRRDVFRKMPNKEHFSKKQTFKNQQLDEGNIGFRMLQKQGWSGGSLGNNEEGILEPIGFQKKDDKVGLGAEEDRPQKIPVEAFMLAIKQYAAGNALYDLVFSTQFSKHQIIKLKDFASSLRLFPQMIGKKKQLVISKNLTLHAIKEGVLKGHSDLCAKYSVIPPLCQRFK